MSVEFIWRPKGNQSVENAGVALVKGANERNEFFENKTTKIYNVQGKGLTIFRDELISDELRQLTKVDVTLRQ